jgi:hypothetical protein
MGSTTGSGVRRTGKKVVMFNRRLQRGPTRVLPCHQPTPYLVMVFLHPQSVASPQAHENLHLPGHETLYHLRHPQSSLISQGHPGTGTGAPPTHSMPCHRYHQLDTMRHTWTHSHRFRSGFQPDMLRILSINL